MKRLSEFLLCCVLVLLFPALTQGGERKNDVLMSWGTGVQHGEGQRNSQFAVDYEFYQFQRSPRSGFSFGIGYTRLTTDAATDKSIDVFSIYPQLTLWPVSPSLRGTYFFVRALGPSYMSANRLGSRQQDNHLTFQAQVGVGYRKQLAGSRAMLLQVSWKHFSNANLFADNDGIDIPMVLTLGFAY